MTSPLREPLTNSAPTLFLLLVGTACSQWNTLTDELARVRDLAGQLAQDRERSGAMEERSAYVLAITPIKEGIARDLLDGRLSLPAAAARFLDLSRKGPQDWTWVQRAYPGETEEGRAAREVVQWAYSEALRDSPAAATAVRDRLNAELEEHLCHFGVICLPE